MKTSLILSVAALVSSLVQAGELPGTGYAVPPAGTVLRAGPGVDFAGVVTLPADTVVRLGEPKGAYREVFVPDGFAVYLHADYVAVNRSAATVMVTGDRVNMRLLPSTEGLLPIAQLKEGTGPLVYLEAMGSWVRVLAPVNAPLYAPEEGLRPGTESELGGRWNTAWNTRESRRQTAVAAWRATDPTWQREAALLERAEALADTDVTRLDEQALAARRAEIARLRSESTWAETQAALLKLDQDIDAVLALRVSARRAAEQVKAAPVPTSDDVAKREARMLALGFRYSGRGEAGRRIGSVHREGSDESPIFTLHTTDGEILKLTAPQEVATLPALVGRHVEMDGRKLYLVTVAGPVFVVDKIVSYKQD
jgi:hypothetical protein